MSAGTSSAVAPGLRSRSSSTVDAAAGPSGSGQVSHSASENNEEKNRFVTTNFVSENLIRCD